MIDDFKIRLETEEADLCFTFFPGRVELEVKVGCIVLHGIDIHLGGFERLLKAFQNYYPETKAKGL